MEKIYRYDKDRYEFRESKNSRWLIHDNIEVARGKRVHSYSLDRYKYKDDKNIYHLIHKGVEVATGKATHSYSLKKYIWQRKNGTIERVDNT